MNHQTKDPANPVVPASWDIDVPVLEELPESAKPASTAESPPSIIHIVEAMLFVGRSPLTFDQVRSAVRGLTDVQFRETIDDLNQKYRSQNRPYAVESQEHGFVLALRPRYRAVMDRVYGQAREARLTPQAIDVLSLIAYRQPLTRQEVDTLRGADSAGLLRQLVRRGLVALMRGPENGHEICYVTTSRFLEMFKLASLEDLPRTQEI